MIAAARIHAWLLRSWWLIFPAFAVLTAALGFERTCARPYHLLPGVTSNAALAWPAAIVYLSAHVWITAAYLLTAQRSQSLLPKLTAVRAVWTGRVASVSLMLVLLAVEWAPSPLWRAARRLICGLPP